MVPARLRRNENPKFLFAVLGDRKALREPRKQFVVKKVQDGEDFAWTVNIKSPLYRDLLGFLVKAPIMLRVIRTGEGRTDTRYTVKAA